MSTLSVRFYIETSLTRPGDIFNNFKGIIKWHYYMYDDENALISSFADRSVSYQV